MQNLTRYPHCDIRALSKQTFSQIKCNTTRQAITLGKSSFTPSSFTQQILLEHHRVPGLSLGVSGIFFFEREMSHNLPEYLPCPDRFASNLSPHSLSPPTVNTMDPATREVSSDPTQATLSHMLFFLQ